jgi:hypothetical protein
VEDPLICTLEKDDVIDTGIRQLGYTPAYVSIDDRGRKTADRLFYLMLKRESLKAAKLYYPAVIPPVKNMFRKKDGGISDCNKITFE